MRDKQDAPFVMAGCGHELYTGERAYFVQLRGGGRWLCPDCLRDWARGLGCAELAALLNLPETEIFCEEGNAPCRTGF